MSVTLTNETANGRIKIAVTSLGSADIATVERSTDQIRWTMVRGANAVVPVGSAITVYDYEFAPNVANYYRARGIDLPSTILSTQTANITPALTVVWLKSVARPFLNLVVELADDRFDVSRASRGAAYPIVGRSLPVAVTDLRGSRVYTIALRTDDPADADALDVLFSTGDILFLQAPEGFVVPSGGVYVTAGDATATLLSPPDDLRWLVVAMTEVVAPGADVVGAGGTWQSVLNTYTDWTDVLGSVSSWKELLEITGSPADVIVP